MPLSNTSSSLTTVPDILQELEFVWKNTGPDDRIIMSQQIFDLACEVQMIVDPTNQYGPILNSQVSRCVASTRSTPLVKSCADGSRPHLQTDLLYMSPVNRFPYRTPDKDLPGMSASQHFTPMPVPQAFSSPMSVSSHLSPMSVSTHLSPMSSSPHLSPMSVVPHLSPVSVAPEWSPMSLPPVLSPVSPLPSLNSKMDISDSTSSLPQLSYYSPVGGSPQLSSSTDFVYPYSELDDLSMPKPSMGSQDSQSKTTGILPCFKAASQKLQEIAYRSPCKDPPVNIKDGICSSTLRRVTLPISFLLPKGSEVDVGDHHTESESSEMLSKSSKESTSLLPSIPLKSHSLSTISSAFSSPSIPSSSARSCSSGATRTSPTAQGVYNCSPLLCPQVMLSTSNDNISPSSSDNTKAKSKLPRQDTPSCLVKWKDHFVSKKKRRSSTCHLESSAADTSRLLHDFSYWKLKAGDYDEGDMLEDDYRNTENEAAEGDIQQTEGKCNPKVRSSSTTVWDSADASSSNVNPDSLFNNNRHVPMKKRFSANFCQQDSACKAVATTIDVPNSKGSSKRRGKKRRGAVFVKETSRTSRAKQPIQGPSAEEEMIDQIEETLTRFMSSNKPSSTKLLSGIKQKKLVMYARLCYISAVPTQGGITLRKTRASRPPTEIDREWMLS